ncbi:MAG TPA: 8-amino-7-oxononanoate synthase [Usitatibacter sp.]|nr:8-amino-7-oxononanoate synthase [Usitatibacter sp.]
MNGLADRLAGGLAALDRDGLRREPRVLQSPQGARVRVAGRELLNFSSNDYLGLAAHPSIREAAHAAIDAFGFGAGASPLVSGNLQPHEDAQRRFASFVRMPRALLFGSGYAANLGIVAALCDRGSHVFGDRLDHACLVDGALLSRAKFTRYPHGDAGALERALAASTAARKLVATDAVFSMDGDVAPIPELLALCERHDAWLLVDDAHGIGVLGESGRGTLEHLGVRSGRIVYMATLGKALGGYGAFVAGGDALVEWLLQRARTYMFSTALPAACAAVAVRALDLLESGGAGLDRLRSNIARLNGALDAAGLRGTRSATAIHPLIAGDASAAVAWSARLLERGMLVPAIRPPTVPHGTSRLRVSLSAAHSPEDVDALAAALADTAPR